MKHRSVAALVAWDQTLLINQTTRLDQGHFLKISLFTIYYDVFLGNQKALKVTLQLPVKQDLKVSPSHPTHLHYHHKFSRPQITPLITYQALSSPNIFNTDQCTEHISVIKPIET